MKIAILSANLGNFDKPVEPIKQSTYATYHCFADEDFPPISGLTPRLQYRIPKMFGWEMFPGYDYYVWLDGSMTLTREDSLQFLIDSLGEEDIAFFKHPWRKTIKEEVDHIEERLQINDPYITPRYKNGLHKESLVFCDPESTLYASPVFIYRNSPEVRAALGLWWAVQSRYFSCDQITLTYAMNRVNLGTIPGDPFKNKYVKVGSKHK